MAGIDGEMILFDCLGKEVERLYVQAANAGKNTTLFSTAAIPEGLYLLRITSGTAVRSLRILVLH